MLVVGGGRWPRAACSRCSLTRPVVRSSPRSCARCLRPAPLGPDRVARPRGRGVRPRRCLVGAHGHGGPADRRGRAPAGPTERQTFCVDAGSGPTGRRAHPRPPSRATSWWAWSRRAPPTLARTIAVRDAFAAQPAGRAGRPAPAPGARGQGRPGRRRTGRRRAAHARRAGARSPRRTSWSPTGSGRSRCSTSSRRRRGHRRRQDTRPPSGAAARDRPDPRSSRPSAGRVVVRLKGGDPFVLRAGAARRGRLPGGRRPRRGDPRGEQRVRCARRRGHPADPPRHGRCRARDERARRLVVGRPHGPAGRVVHRRRPHGRERAGHAGQPRRWTPVQTRPPRSPWSRRAPCPVERVTRRACDDVVDVAAAAGCAGARRDRARRRSPRRDCSSRTW